MSKTKAKTKPKTKAKRDLVAATEAKYGVRLPREYAEFLRQGRFREKKLAMEEGGAVYFIVVDEVHGHPESLEGSGDEIRNELFSSAEEEGVELGTFVPFARIGDEDTLGSASLAIDVSKANKKGLCPVLLYEHDDGSFEEVAASIEEFLESCEELDEDEDDDDEDDERDGDDDEEADEDD